MNHEPECVFVGIFLRKDSCGTCNRLRAAYQRGRQDAAEVVLTAFMEADIALIPQDPVTLYDAALGGDM